MKFDYDRSTDIMMIELSEENIDHAEEVDNMIIHLSKDGTPVLLEILDSREFLSKLSKMIEAPI